MFAQLCNLIFTFNLKQHNSITCALEVPIRQRGSGLKLHSLGGCLEVYEKMFLLLTIFMTLANMFLLSLWSKDLV